MAVSSVGFENSLRRFLSDETTTVLVGSVELSVEQVAQIAAILPDSKITSLTIRDSHIDSAGARILAEKIAGSKVVELDLSGNPIDKAALKACEDAVNDNRAAAGLEPIALASSWTAKQDERAATQGKGGEPQR